MKKQPSPSPKCGGRPAPTRAAQAEIRALPLYQHLPAGHLAVLVTDAWSAPHLKPGELAIIDVGDRYAVSGELFLIRSPTSGRCAIRELKRDEQIIRPNGEPETVWWVRDLAGPRSNAEVEAAIDSGVMLRTSDGPFKAETLDKMILGRVAGLAPFALLAGEGGAL